MDAFFNKGDIAKNQHNIDGFGVRSDSLSDQEIIIDHGIMDVIPFLGF